MPPNGKNGPGKGAAPEPPKPVTRPEKPSLPPDPRELKVQPDPNGKIRFNFHGQPWADVLEWLAAISGMSLDWQELPGDYLNLVTRKEYTVPEARDLVNRHLLARGFTLLEHGEVLSVVKIDKLNPGLVPRVEPEDLARRLPHDYVKVSFPLQWLISESAVEELKPMLSPNAKLTPLKNTNRLEAMDAAVNLREVYALLKREQSNESQQRLVKEFPLEHTRSTDILDKLKALLGIETKAANQPMSREQMEQMQQQAMMMQQMQQQGRPPQQPAKKNDDIHLIADSRKNCILANAPPDKMEIISQAVAALDVESSQTQSLLTNINRMQVHRLHAVDPAAVVKTLLDVGQLEPTTRLEVDDKNRAIIAYASLADQMVIRQVLERLDGSGRKFDVVVLRRLEADYVAGTIEFMMVGPKKEEQRPRYFDFFSFGRGRDDAKETDQFRVDADTENNRLLLWANEVELAEVMNLLEKLGEIPQRGGNPDRVRVWDSIAPDQLPAVMEQLRQAWPGLSPNPLQLPPSPTLPPSRAGFDSYQTPQPATPAADKPDPPAEPATPPEKEPATAPASNTPTRPAVAVPPAIPAFPRSRLITFPGEAEPNQERSAPPATDSTPDASRPTASPTPPVRVILAPDGRLLLSSDDPQALDLLEELLRQVAPPRRDYRIYRLEHADAFWVRKNLESFFEETDGNGKNGSSRYVYYFDNYSPPDKGDSRQRLSRRKKLKFIDDLDTNSILVQGADGEQLRTIEELIRVYDQPQITDSNAARVSAVISVRYSKAQTIATAVKDVYRDLLSDNDKALASNNPEQKNRVPSGANTYIFNEGGEGNGEKERTRVTFKGKLSIGVDEVTNTLLVSTEGDNLMRNVTEMIRSLDEAAKPLSAVSVLKLNGNSNGERVREVLGRMLLESKSAAKPATAPAAPQPPGAESPAPMGEAPLTLTP